MDNTPDPNVISTLQMEYNAIRQEIRDLINSMDTNLNIGVSMISGVVALASFTKELSILYIIPSMIFMATCVHLIKTAATNVHGAYCQVIETRLKSLLGQKMVLLEWEGGELSQHSYGPAGVVQTGFYLYFIGISTIFVAVAILAYRWESWTAYVHASEAVMLLIYAIVAIRWNTSSRRAEIVERHLGGGDEVSTPHRGASDAVKPGRRGTRHRN